jgi:hypothetical protein
MTIFLTVYLAIAVGSNAVTDQMVLPVDTLAHCRQVGEDALAPAHRDNPLVYATRYHLPRGKEQKLPHDHRPVNACLLRERLERQCCCTMLPLQTGKPRWEFSLSCGSGPDDVCAFKASA